MSVDAGWARLAETELQLDVPAEPPSLAVVRHVAGGWRRRSASTPPASTFELRSVPSGGTEVVMTFVAAP